MSDTHPAPLSISTIHVSLARQSQKRVESIKLSTNTESLVKNIETTLQAGDTHKAELLPFLAVTSDDHIFVSARCSSRFRKGYSVVVDIDLRDAGCMHEDKGIKTYRKTLRNVEVVASCPSISLMPALDSAAATASAMLAPDSQIPTPDPQMSDSVFRTLGLGSPTLHPDNQMPKPDNQISHSQAPGKLIPTTDDLIRTCAKFRILIIGNSGVGKSTLIQKMFGVKDVHVSGTVRGKADIDKEFISAQNERFVVHDSLGFEAGEARNIGVVQDFVKRRQAMPRLEDQLHAIWLCVETPYSGGRLVERGVEQLLKNQRDALGNIPLIVVLTKVDLLDIQLELEAQDNEPPESRRKKHLDKYCIEPLQKAAERDVTCVAVSAEKGYYILVSTLMEATQENMAKHSIDEAPRAMASIAQRVDFKEKIRLSIEVGGQKYWKNLLMSAVLRGHTLKECLEVIREDIVTVWNFTDLDYGSLDEKLIKDLVPDNISPSILNSWKTSLDDPKFFSDMAKNVATVLRLPYDSYKEAILDVEVLMCYIVDLICVMQVIFLLAPDGSVGKDIVNRAIKECEGKKEAVHDSIKRFNKKQTGLAGQDRVFQEIETLIWRYSLSEAEITKLRKEAIALTSNA